MAFRSPSSCTICPRTSARSRTSPPKIRRSFAESKNTCARPAPNRPTIPSGSPTYSACASLPSFFSAVSLRSTSIAPQPSRWSTTRRSPGSSISPLRSRPSSRSTTPTTTSCTLSSYASSPASWVTPSSRCGFRHWPRARVLLWSIFRLGLLVFGETWLLPLFAFLAAANPLVLDFQVAARGYGMALALFFFALERLVRFTSAPQDRKLLWHAAAGFSLSVMANLVFVVPAGVVALTFAAIFPVLLCRNLRRTRTGTRRTAGAVAVAGLLRPCRRTRCHVSACAAAE